MQFDRKKAPYKKATKFYIGLEGSKTEPGYFAQLQVLLEKDASLDLGRVIIEVFPPQNGSEQSDPRQVMERLFASEARLDEDQCWCVFDTDGRNQSSLHTVATDARHHGFKLALSNPMFEVWLLWHHVDVCSESTSGALLVDGVVTGKKDLKATRGTHDQGRPLTHEGLAAALERHQASGALAEQFPPLGTSQVGFFIEALLQACTR